MTKENIVLVTADSVRADYCFGHWDGYETTPNLERIASDGVRFNNAISPGPRTPVSVPEFLTGEYMPFETVESREHRFNLIKHMTTHHETLPERLSKMGYNTGAVTVNPYTTSKVNISDIFDLFYAEGEYKEPPFISYIPSYRVRKWLSFMNQYFSNLHWFAQWPSFYDDILSATNELEEPYFLWIFLLDPHNPYIAPREDRKESTTVGMYHGLLRSNEISKGPGDKSYYRNSLPDSIEEKIKRAYRDTIRSVDRFLSQLWTDIQDTDPVLIFHSDHGEAFNEHGTYGHQSELYEENIRVPLVIYNSDSKAVVDSPVSLRQLPEMIVEYVSQGVPFDHPKWHQEYTVSRDEDGDIALRGEEWKYIARGEREWLFNLSTDPEEKLNLASEREDLIMEMRARKDEILANIDSDIDAKLEGDIDQDLVNRLESLGYVEE